MVGLVAPALFVACGETLESARALALQAERAEVLRLMQVPRTRWFTHRVLPVCPYPPGASGTEMDPWSVPAGFGELDRATHFAEPAIYAILHHLVLRDALFGPGSARDWKPWPSGGYSFRRTVDAGEMGGW